MFSGIEAASCAWHPLGWEAVAVSEIEEFPCAVLKHHYPLVPNVGDMTKVDWASYRGKVDLVVGGSPCQAFSMAGLRQSLEDERGNLTLEYVRAVLAVRPRYVIWENVPGVLNTPDNAFGAFLAGLSGAVAPLVPPAGGWESAGVVSPSRPDAYGLCWRVLNAQHFGVAQRRRRVFLAGYLGDWRRAVQILFEPGGMRRHFAEGDQAWQGDPSCSGPSPAAGPIAYGIDEETNVGSDLMGTLKARQEGGGFEGAVEIPDPIVVIQDARGMDKNQNGLGFSTEDVAYTLDRTGAQAVMAFDTYNQTVGDVAQTLCSRGDTPGGNAHLVPAVLVPGPVEQGAPPVSFDADSVAPTLTSSNDPSRSPQSSEVTQQVAAVYAESMQIRRLTVTECEFLMGFPRNYTRIPVKHFAGKPRSKHYEKFPDMYSENEDGSWTRYSTDSPRYKALGNSMVVPVMAWIGKRVDLVDAQQEQP